MNRVKICFLPCAVACLLVLMVLAPAIVYAWQPGSVELLRFELRTVSTGVEIFWETATESDIAYFKVKRGPAPDGPYADLAGIGLVEAMGSAVSGHVYTAVDRTAAAGQNYSYQLVELTLSNQENIVAERDITVAGSSTTPEVISGPPPTNPPVPTSSTQTGTLTPQPTTNTTPAGTTPLATAALAGSVTPIPSATFTESSVLTTPTRAANTLGPTPTRFSFTPQPATGATTNQTGAPVVEAAAPSALAQVTGEPYPAPDDSLPTALATEAISPQIDALEQAPLAYPGGTLSTSLDLPGSVGAGVPVAASAGAGAEQATTQETPGTTRLLLWLGFLAAFFIFVGGIGFSIVLSTRRRENDLS